MRIRLNIQQKIQFFVLSSTVILYVIVIAFISGQTKRSAKNEAKKLADSFASQYANEIQSQLNADAAVVRTLAQAYLVYKDLPEQEWKTLFSNMYRNIFSKNPQFYSIWDSWELSRIDKNWTKPYGRYVYTYWREGSQEKHDSTLRSLDGDPAIYEKVKKSEKEEIWDPYFDNFADQKTERKLMTTISSPIIDNGIYTGIVAVDITLDRFEVLIDRIVPFKGEGHALFVAYDGTIVAHPDRNLVGKSIAKENPADDEKHRFIEKIQRGEPIAFISENEDSLGNSNQAYVSFAPVKIGNTTTPWSIGIVVPVKVIMEEAQKNYILSLLSILLILAVLTLVIWYISRNISIPIKKITELLKRMSEGEINETMKIKVNTDDEISEMCKALDVSIDGLVAKVEFANAIGRGNLSSNLQLLGEKDILGESLIEMQRSLKEANEEELKRKAEEQKRTWANEGYAKFGDVLRQTNNLRELSYEVIKNLVYYLKANQGGLFILNDEEKEHQFLELMAAFAFDRRKYLEKKINIGEGLVGTCAIEKEKIYITEIPQNYINITSGLGDANPTSLLLAPLKVEEDILGVIEIASFNKFEPFEIEFVEKIAEDIASTFLSVKINEQTAKLLGQTKQQAEEMAAQEEEMRQNMEELQATQEESLRRASETESYMEAINCCYGVIELDFGGLISRVNEYFAKIAKISNNQLVGSNYKDLLAPGYITNETVKELLMHIKNGGHIQAIHPFMFDGSQKELHVSFFPFKDETGSVVKAFIIVTDYLKPEE